MKSLNFNNVKKSYFTVTLADENHTTIMIGTPTKAILDDLELLQDGLDSITDDDIDTDATNELYSTCAKVISHNKTGTKITKEFLEEIFDFEDINIFLSAYMDFISEVTDVKN